jgi:hypothetical protein
MSWQLHCARTLFDADANGIPDEAIGGQNHTHVSASGERSRERQIHLIQTWKLGRCARKRGVESRASYPDVHSGQRTPQSDPGAEKQQEYLRRLEARIK